MVERGCCKEKKEDTIQSKYENFFSLKINPYSNVLMFRRAKHMENCGIKINVVTLIFMFALPMKLQKSIKSQRNDSYQLL